MGTATNLSRRLRRRHLGISRPQPVPPMRLEAVAATNAVHLQVQQKRHTSRNDLGDDQREARTGIKLPAMIKKTTAISTDTYKRSPLSVIRMSRFVNFLISLWVCCQARRTPSHLRLPLKCASQQTGYSLLTTFGLYQA